MKKCFKKWLVPTAFGLLAMVSGAMAENPIFQTYYSPDPAPVVFGDTVCVYTGNDEGGPFFTMHGWRVSCSTDMVNWTDRGELILQHSDFNGSAKANGDWAAQVIRRNGKYYYYVTVESSRGGRAINVAVADKPEGPFKDALNGKHLAGPNWDYIDPTVWIDDDGQAYLYWGNPTLYWAKLNEDMISINGEIHKTEMTEAGFGPKHCDNDGKCSASAYTEGPWIHKRGNKYYMIYASHGVPEKISYSTSDSPTGPWKWAGVIMDQGNGTAFTNHSGLIDFKGRSFFFYHNQKNVSGGGYSRSTAVEEFTWNADGSIPLIKSTNDGVKTPIHNLDPYTRVEAETKSWVGGINVDKTDGYTIIRHVKSENGHVYLTNMGSEFYTKVRSVDMSDGADRIVVSTRGNGGKLEVHSGAQDGKLLATVNVPASSDWQENSFDVSGAEGVTDVYFVVKQGGFDFDYWYLESDAQAVPQEPFNGKAIAIPGKIEAENYDKTGVGRGNNSYYDKDPKNQGGAYREDGVDIVSIPCGVEPCEDYAIGYTEDGEWVEYTIEVSDDAEYDITANIATPFETAGFQLFIDDEPITEKFVAPKIDTTFDVYDEVKVGSAKLTKGEHVLKLMITGAYINVNWLKFTDPSKPEAIAFKNHLGISKTTYKVYNLQGKYLGIVDIRNTDLHQSMKNAGYDSGIYMLRGKTNFTINMTK